MSRVFENCFRAGPLAIFYTKRATLRWLKREEEGKGRA
jgi:hypothetical protein